MYHLILVQFNLFHNTFKSHQSLINNLNTCKIIATTWPYFNIHPTNLPWIMVLFLHKKGIIYFLSSCISFSNLSPSHLVFTLATSSHFQPKTFTEAYKFPHWREAMKGKIYALEANNTWALTNIPLEKI